MRNFCEMNKKEEEDKNLEHVQRRICKPIYVNIEHFCCAST